MAARLLGQTIVTRESIERDLHHDLAATRRPAPFALDVFQTLEETADIEKQPGEFRPNRVKRAAQSLARRDGNIGECAASSLPAAALRHRRAQFAVTRGVICARVKSPRKRSPAWNCVT